MKEGDGGKGHEVFFLIPGKSEEEEEEVVGNYGLFIGKRRAEGAKETSIGTTCVPSSQWQRLVDIFIIEMFYLNHYCIRGYVQNSNTNIYFF